MIRHFLFLTIAVTLSASFSLANETVLKGDPVVIPGKRDDAIPSLTTTVELSAIGSQNGTAELSSRAANFYVASNSAHSFNDTFALRGLTNTPIFGDPAVTFYLDDIPLGGTFTTPETFSGITRAKLNRGPGQNTIFGQAGSAGVVQLVTPDLGEKSAAQVTLSAGNYASRNAAVTVGTAKGAPLDAFVSVQYATRDGYVFNDRLGQDVDHQESTHGLARVNFHPAHSVKLTLLAQAEHSHDGEQPLVPLNSPYYTIERKTPGKTEFNAQNAGLTATATTAVGQLSATSSFNNWRLSPYRSVLSFGPAELINDVTLSRRTYNEEIKLASADTGVLFWHTGILLSKSTTQGTFSRAFGTFVVEDSSYDIDSHSLAAYGEASLQLQPVLTLTAGLRLEDSRKELDRAEKKPTTQVYSLTRETSALLPKLELNYTPEPNLKLFGSIGAGYKPGGFSAFTGNRALTAFGPERTIALESGITQSALNNTLTSTLRAFLYNIRGYQIERSFATSSVADDYLVVNAPKARSSGAEWEIAWQPLSGLSFSSALGVTHVTLRKFQDPYTGKNYDGKQAPYVPRYDFTLRAEYHHTSGWFGLIQWCGNGRTYYTESEDMAFAQPADSLLSARLGFSKDRWSVTAYAENIFGQHYYSSISAGTNHGTPGAPRIQGIETRITF